MQQMTETYINLEQYRPGGMVYYDVKVTNVINGDFYYSGDCLNLEGAMECIKSHLEYHYPKETDD
jgi:hypothetical protein